MGLGFWVLGFGFWVWDFGIWVLGFGFWILGFGFWVLGLVRLLTVFAVGSIAFASLYVKGESELRENDLRGNPKKVTLERNREKVTL